MNYIIVGILFIGLGTYLVNYGRTEITKKSNIESEQRDKATQDLIKESTKKILDEVGIKEFYVNELKDNKNRIKVAEENIDSILDQLKNQSNSSSDTRKKVLSLFAERKIDDAIELLENEIIEENEKELESDLKLQTQLYLAKLDVQKAVETMKKYLVINESYEKYADAANTFRSLQMIPVADSFISKAISLIEPKDETNETYLDYLLFAGTIKLQLGQNEMGVSMITEYLEKKKFENSNEGILNHVGVLTNLGNYYFNIKSNEKAIEYFEQAKEEIETIYNPKDKHHVLTFAMILQNLSNVYRKHTKNYKKARDYNELAIKYLHDSENGIMDPYFSQILATYNYNSGLINLAMDNKGEAIKDFEKAIESIEILNKRQPLNFKYEKANSLRVLGFEYYQLRNPKWKEVLLESKSLFVELAAKTQRFKKQIEEIDRLLIKDM